MLFINFANNFISPETVKTLETLMSEQGTTLCNITYMVHKSLPYHCEGVSASVIENALQCLTREIPQWKELPILTYLPKGAIDSALIIAHIHGTTGYFPLVLIEEPSILRSGKECKYSVIDLAKIREKARVEAG